MTVYAIVQYTESEFASLSSARQLELLLERLDMSPLIRRLGQMKFKVPATHGRAYTEEYEEKVFFYERLRSPESKYIMTCPLPLNHPSLQAADQLVAFPTVSANTPIIQAQLEHLFERAQALRWRYRHVGNTPVERRRSYRRKRRHTDDVQSALDILFRQ